jgi:hypothetical protein
MHIDDTVATLEVSPGVSALLTETNSAEIYETESDIRPVVVKGTTNGYVPWGKANDLPNDVRKKVFDSDILSPNMRFNILTCYGRGLKYTINDEKDEEEIKTFFKRNRPVPLLLETVTDIKYWDFSIIVLIISNDGQKVVRMINKESMYCRFESCDKKTGKINNVLFANWEDDDNAENPEVIKLLDPRDAWYDLMSSLGKIAYDNGEKKATGVKKFAVLVKFPSPGQKYYPFPNWQSTFRSGWYDVHTMIPKMKKATMKNGMKIRYHVEIHKNYWVELFKSEDITDPEKQVERRKQEFKNIQDFLSGVENKSKVWFSTYYIDPNKVEQRMVRITVVDTTKEGGEWIEDAEEAANMLCYAQGVHPTMNGATPGKSSGGLGGSDKRELFTMKQALEKPNRDMFLDVFYLVAEVNGWDITFEIEDIMLTTLDKGKDAVAVSQFKDEKDDSK